MSWAAEYLAATQVYDFAKDPDDYRVSRQSAVTIAGLLVPLGGADAERLTDLFQDYEYVYQLHLNGYRKAQVVYNLTATMQVMMQRAAERTKGPPPDFKYISIDPRDYSTFSDPGIGDLVVISIHTRPERCWFLGILRFEGALGLSLGRMRVMRPNENGMYPVTIRTKWRALTNKVKQEEVRDAYRRLIRS